MSERQDFATRLREALLDAGYAAERQAESGVSVAELSKVAGVARSMARRYALGESIPDLEKMAVIARWLGVRLQWLRDGEVPKRPNNNPEWINMTPPETRAFLSDWMSLPPIFQCYLARRAQELRAYTDDMSPFMRSSLSSALPTGADYDAWEQSMESELERRRQRQPS